MAKKRKVTKPPTTLTIKLPQYVPDRRAWQHDIDEQMQRVRKERGVEYPRTQKLSVSIQLYLSPRHLDSIDVDNAAKLILDALQGRFGGSKAIVYEQRIIPNDSQVHRLIVEKTKVPDQAKTSGGNLTIRKYTQSV